jgi:hypothetical protein
VPTKRKTAPAKRARNEVEIYEPSPPAEIYEGMRIDGAPVSLTALITGLGLFYACAFQIGYFINVGVEFMPFMSAVDFVFPAAAMMGLGILWIPLGEFLFKRVRRHVEKGTFDTSLLAFVTSNYFKYELLLLGAVFVVLGLVGVNLFELVRWTALLALFVAASVMVLKLKEEAFFMGRFLGTTCFWFALHSGTLALGLGAAYAEHFAGKRCDVRSADRSYVDATYLRPAGEGHLIRAEGQVLFLGKSEVKEIACGRRKVPPPTRVPTLGADWPLP